MCPQCFHIEGILSEEELLLRNSCADNWHQPAPNLRTSTSNCYKFLLTPARNWYQARKDCETENGIILNLETVEESDWVHHLTNNPNISDIYNAGIVLWWIDAHAKMYGPRNSTTPKLNDGRDLMEAATNFNLVLYENTNYIYWATDASEGSDWDYFMKPNCYAIYPASDDVFSYLYPLNCFQKGTSLGVICKRPKLIQFVKDPYREKICNETSGFTDGQCKSEELESDAANSCYRIFSPDSNITWADGFRICNSLGYEGLVEIDSDKEALFFLNVLPNYSSPDRFLIFGQTYSEWWAVGLHRNLYGDLWKGRSQNEMPNATLFKWAPDMPDNALGMEYCGSIFRINWNSNGLLEFNDIPCESNWRLRANGPVKIGLVCERRKLIPCREYSTTIHSEIGILGDTFRIFEIMKLFRMLISIIIE